ncbi:MAG: isopentenyl-diphosphate Delta-isomerase [Ferruginibacter sp.]
MLQVILVNERDEPTGAMEKIEAHEKGLLHRAFSVFIFNEQGEMLLQQRAPGKYHSPNLWTNACCSHPAPGEEVSAAAHRRLKEEMGFDTELEKAFAFTYRAEFENGLTEHEFDHVFVGRYNGPVNPDPLEVSRYRYLNLRELRKELQEQPGLFTEWFKIADPRLEEYLANREPEVLSPS